MTRNFKIFLCLCLAAFFVLGIFMVTAINNIQFSYNGGGYYGGMNEDYLAVRIAEEMAKQQNNLFSSVKEELQSPDIETFTAQFAVTALPREFTEATTATLYAGGQSVPMKMENGAFVGRIKIPLDDEGGEYRILLQDGKQYRSQAFPLEMKGFAPGWQVFGMNQFSSSGSGPITDYTLEQGFTLDETFLPFGDKAASARLFALEDGKGIYSEPLQEGLLEVSHTFQLKVDVPIWLYGEVTGRSGLTYRYLLVEIRRPYPDSMTVSTKDFAEGMNLLQAIAPDGKKVDLPVEFY